MNMKHDQENILQDELVEDVEALDEELLEDDALEEALKMDDDFLIEKRITIDVDHTGEDIKATERKYSIKIKHDGESQAYVTGQKQNLLKFLSGPEYAMRKNDIKDMFPELLEDNFKEDLNALVESEATLSENFRNKASLIFESALRAKVASKVNQLEEEYNEKLDEAVETAKEGLVEKVDSYLAYVVESWAVENKIALESGVRADIAESFMSNLKNVFEAHYVSVPEGKEDLVDTLSAEVEKLKEDYNAEVDKNMALQESTNELSRVGIIAEAATDLSVAQADKLSSLLEGEDFGDVKAFTKKVETLKQSYFKKDSVISEDVNTPDETLKEETVEVSGTMATYLSALKKLNQ
jgi:hypothetical protein